MRLEAQVFPQFPKPFQQEPKRDFSAIHTIHSKDGKFQVEIRLKKDVDLNTTVLATMKSSDGKTLWERDVQGDDPSIDPGNPPPGIIGDDGSFFIFLRYRYFYSGWALVTPASETHLTPRDRDRPSYFASDDPSLIRIARENGEKIVTVWDRDLDAWTAFRARNGERIDVTPAQTAKWNQETREEVLRKIGDFRNNALVQELSSVSSTAALLAAMRTRPNPAKLNEIDLEFLAIRRDRRDRVVFERILGADAKRFDDLVWHSAQIYRPTFGSSARFNFTSPARITGSRLLSVFDGEAQKTYSMNKAGMRGGLSSSSRDYIDIEKRPHLGQINGIVRFSTPMRNPIGYFRFHLVPGGDTTHWESRSGKEYFEVSSSNLTEEMADTASFSFSTVLPGKYFLKTIWDRRSPLTDTNHAGPGDYESAWAGPIEVKGGTIMTDVALDCTNRAVAGTEYYRADEAVAKAWDDGEMVQPGSENTEAFRAMANNWILKTNSATLDRHGWINSIAMRKGYPCKPYQSRLPGGLVVYARERMGSLKNELSQLEIRDEHGCPYKVSLVSDSSGLTQFYFPSFPRADEIWHLLGSDSNSAPLFEFTLTNLVRAPAREIPPLDRFPLEIAVGPVQLRVTNIFRQYVEAWEPLIDGKIFQNGVTNTNWIMIDTRFLDRHGNATSPTNFCREEKTVRVTGKALIRWGLRGKDPYSIDFDKLPDCYPFEFAVPREAIQKEKW